jgi:hypothetical protein
MMEIPEVISSSQKSTDRKGSTAAKVNIPIMATVRYAAKMRRGHFFSGNEPMEPIYNGPKIYAIGFWRFGGNPEKLLLTPFF